MVSRGARGKRSGGLTAVRPAPENGAMNGSDADSGRRGRAVVRAADRAALATLEGDGAPFASLVVTACTHEASPLLLLSDLARHTRNAAADSRVSLLFDGTGGLVDPLTGPRVTVLGELVRDDDPAHLARFCARHPGAEAYAGFGDFSLYRVRVARAHMVAGFGDIVWIARDGWRFDAAGAAALAEAEPGIVAHMNQDHADALALYATRLLGRPDGAWRMTGIDPEGCDLRLGGAVARLDFAAPVADAEAARTALVGAVDMARRTG